jgi:hypothetical protein
VLFKYLRISRPDACGRAGAYPYRDSFHTREFLERIGLNPRTQLRQGGILELTDSLSRKPKLLTHFFESLRFGTIQSESL